MYLSFEISDKKKKEIQKNALQFDGFSNYVKYTS